MLLVEWDRGKEEMMSMNTLLLRGTNYVIKCGDFRATYLVTDFCCRVR